MSVLWIVYLFGIIWVVLILIVLSFHNKNNKTFVSSISAIRNNGELLFKKNCGGRIGSSNFTHGMMSVYIYDTGIIFSPKFKFVAPECCLLSEEICELGEGELSFTKGTAIIHSSKNLDKTIFIYCVLPDQVKQKLLK